MTNSIDKIDLNDPEHFPRRELMGDDLVMVFGGDGGAAAVPGNQLGCSDSNQKKLFDSLKNDVDTCLLYYPHAGGVAQIYSPLARFSSPPKSVFRDDVRCYQGTQSATTTPSSLMAQDRNGLWNTSSTVIFHINNVNEIDESSDNFSVDMLSGSDSNSFSPALGSLGISAAWVYNGGFSSRGSVSFSKMKAQLLNGWNICTMSRRQIAGEDYFRSILSINGSEVQNTYMDSFRGNVSTNNDAVTGSKVSTNTLIAKPLSPVAVFFIQNRFVSESEQVKILEKFKADHT